MSKTTFKIGVVGVGAHGREHGRRLVEKGFQVTEVYDVRRESATELAAELKCHAAEKLSQVTAGADLILTVVSDDKAMRDGLHPPPGTTCSRARRTGSSSTSPPSPPRSTSRSRPRPRRRARRRSRPAWPPASPRPGREPLYLILAGDKAVVEKTTPVLEALSQARRYVGETGRAAQVKALVNMVMNINTAGLAEGLAIGDALGIDLNLLREIFSQTGANSRVLETDGADMQGREHDCYFSSAHAAKDSGIAVALAGEAGIPVPLAQATLAQYRLMIEKGLGELDKSGVAELTLQGPREEVGRWGSRRTPCGGGKRD